MSYTFYKTNLETILPLRAFYLKEMNCQIRYNAVHERGWSDVYLIKRDKENIGYAAIKGFEELWERDTVFEFYIIPVFRKNNAALFQTFLDFAKPKYMECQSNDVFLTALLYEFSKNIKSEVILFKEGINTHLAILNIIFRKKQANDIVFQHKAEPEGDYILEHNGEIVATGGYLTHYNPPFVDLYMEVYEPYRLKGYGSFLLQEIKKVCLENGKVPAARCNLKNYASKATLLKAGFEVAGFMLSGKMSLPRFRNTASVSFDFK